MAKPMRDAVMTDGRQEEGGRHAEVDTEQGRQAFAGALCREISSGAHRDVASYQTSSNRCAKLQPNETKDVQGLREGVHGALLQTQLMLRVMGTPLAFQCPSILWPSIPLNA